MLEFRDKRIRVLLYNSGDLSSSSLYVEINIFFVVIFLLVRVQKVYTMHILFDFIMIMDHYNLLYREMRYFIIIIIEFTIKNWVEIVEVSVV